MKTKLWVLIFLVAAAVAQAQTNNLTALLQQGLFEEQANRNLDAAIASYASLAKQFDKDRQLAATAVFRLGECYRAQGRTNEAAVHYQRILRDFSDQTVLATLSRQNLAGMGMVKTEVAMMENFDAQLFKKLEGKSFEELARILPTLLPDAALADLLQKRNEAQAKQVSLLADYGTNNVEVQRLEKLQNQLSLQIANKIIGMMEGLKLRAELPASAGSDGRRQQKELLAKQISLAEQDLAEKQKLVQLGQAAPTDARATERELLRLKQQLAALDSGGADLVDLTVPAKSEEDQEIARIEKLIKDSPDLINKAEGGSDTLLSKAALKGQVKVVNYLLEHGAEVDAGFPALSQAARAGNRAMVELLLARGANVNNPSEYGRTALTMAAEQGFVSVVEVLLAHKADPNAVDSRSGRTALYSTLMRGQDNCARRLIAAGAQVNTEAEDGTTALSLVAERGGTAMAKMLLEAKADPNAGKKNQPLLAAIAAKNLELVELLLKAGANPNAAGSVNFIDARVKADANYLNHTGSMTPLWFAIYQNQPEMVRLLLKYKADPNDAQTDRQPVIFKTLDKPEMLTALLEGGANVEARDETSEPARTPLLKASQFIGGTNVVGILLKHGANPNAADADGNKPLHLAAGNLAFEETFTLLLEHQADPNVRNKAGMTPLDLAKVALTSPGWRFSQNSPTATSEQKAFAEKIIMLLRAHGALDNLPDWNRITVSRPAANFSETVFQRGTNDWNRFTLLELLYAKYRNRSTELDFADLAHITVARPSANGAKIKRVAVNLLNATNGLEATRDIPLEFGDVVEIPERQHALADRSGFLAEAVMQTIQFQLSRRAGEAQLTVSGNKTIPLKLPEFRARLKDILFQAEAQAVLTSSSDLSRVKVTRRDAQSGKTREWIVDCAPANSPNNSALTLPGGGVATTFAQRLNGIMSGASAENTADLWLRDGDVIEVPEKQP